jgi:hypothetical protein
MALDKMNGGFHFIIIGCPPDPVFAEPSASFKIFFGISGNSSFHIRRNFNIHVHTAQNIEISDSPQ